MQQQEVLQEIEQTARSQFLPIIGPEKGRILVDVVKKRTPKRVLEVGTLVGYSAILISQHLPSGGRIVTIEINPALAAEARKNLERARVADKVEIKTGNALEVIPTLGGTFDLLFLDAAKEEYLDYLNLAEPKLAENAIVVADNVGIFADSMQDYLEYVRDSGKYESRTYEAGNDAVEASVRRW